MNPVNARGRLLRLLCKHGLLKDYNVYKQPANADGEPDGDPVLLGIIRGYFYIPRRFNRVGNIFVDIPGIILNTTNSQMIVVTGGACCIAQVELSVGLLIDINGQLMEITQIIDNLGVSQTIIFKA